MKNCCYYTQNSYSQNLKCKSPFKSNGCTLFFDKALTDTEWQIIAFTRCLFSLQPGSPFLFILCYMCISTEGSDHCDCISAEQKQLNISFIELVIQ